MTDLYRPLRDEYAWHVPRFFNLAQACCFLWADLPSHSKSPAIEIVGPDGHTQTLSFQGLAELANKLALGLDRMGARTGDRVAIVMRERTETLALLIACWARQCIAVPLASTEHGDTLTQRIRQSRCRLVFMDDSEPDKVLSALQRCQRVQQIVGLDVRADNVMSWHGLLARDGETPVSEPTRPQQPALLVWPHRSEPIYPPQTAYLVAHQALIGNLPGFVASNNWFPKDATGLLTTHALMSEAGLLGAILPSLYFGVGVRLQATLPHTPKVLETGSFSISHLSTNAGLLCHWLKHSEQTPDFALKGVSVFGEYLSAHWRERARQRLGEPVNLCTFVAGCGLLWGDSHQKWPADPNCSGRIYPGHQVTHGTDSGPLTEMAQTQECRSIYVNRIDPAGDSDPAIYIGLWPLKDPADIVEPMEIVTEHPVGLQGKLAANGTLILTGWQEDAVHLGNQCIHPLVIEQAAMALPEISMAAALHPLSKKNGTPTQELWLILELDASISYAQAMRDNLADRILEALDTQLQNYPVRLGVVTRVSIDNHGHPRRDLLRLRHGFSGVQPLSAAASEPSEP